MKTKNTKRPEVRTLKIHSRYRAAKRMNKLVPEIKLCGNWLQRTGFEQGQNITVAVMKQLLIIRLAEE